MNTFRRLCFFAIVLFVSSSSLRAAEPPHVISDALRGRCALYKNGALAGLPDAEVAGKKYYALYFSAGWCAPCQAFTPKLVAFYQAMKRSTRTLK